MYQYEAKVIEVIDGDTLWVEIDLGFKIFHKVKIRLKGVWCPELNAHDGPKARANLIELLQNQDYSFKKLLIITEKDKMSYDRYVATVYALGNNINEAMIKNGYI